MRPATPPKRWSAQTLTVGLAVTLTSLLTGAPAGVAAAKVKLTAVQSGAQQVTLSWTRPTTSPLTQRVIVAQYPTTGSTAAPRTVRTITLDPAATTTVVTGLASRQRYRFTLNTTAPKASVSTNLTIVAKPDSVRNATTRWVGEDLVVSWSALPSTTSVLAAVTATDGRQVEGVARPGVSKLVFSSLDTTGSYKVTLTPTNAYGNGTPTRLDVKGLAPGAPNVTASALTPSSVQLTWNGVRASTWKLTVISPGALRHGVTLTYPATTTSAVITGLSTSKSYQFSVVGVNRQGVGEPGLSSPVLLRTPAAAPTSVTASGVNAGVEIGWKPPTGTAPVAYRVSYRGAADATWVVSARTTELFVTVSSLQNGSPYAFLVESIDADGTATAAEAVLATPAAPPTNPTTPTTPDQPPSGTVEPKVGTTPGDGQIVVTYSDAPSGAVLLWKRSDAASWTTVTTPSSPYTLTGLLNGVEYSVALGDITAIPVTPVVAATPLGSPSSAANPTVTARHSQLDVSWSAPLTTGGYTFEGYRISWNGQNASGQRIVDQYTTSTIITGLLNGYLYTITITAYNTYGDATPVTITGTPTL